MEISCHDCDHPGPGGGSSDPGRVNQDGGSVDLRAELEPNVVQASLAEQSGDI